MAGDRRPQSARRRGPGPRGRPPQRGRGGPRKSDPAREKAPRPSSSLTREALEEIRSSAGARASQVIELLEQVADSLDKDHPPDAVKDAARAKAIASRSSTVREMLGLALYHAGKFKEAIAELQAYRRMTGRPDQNHVLADSFRAVGEPERAVPLADEATRAEVPLEVRAEAAVVGGAALADLGRYEEALALLRRFERKTTTAHAHDLRIWYVMGDVLEKAGRRSEAVSRFKRIMEHDPDAYDVAERLSALS